MIKEFRIGKGLTVAALSLIACLMAFPFTASAMGRFHLGFGFGFYPPAWGFAPPAYYWDSYYGYYGWNYPPPNTGKIKLEDPDKEDHVYLNGAFAGTVSDLKTIHVRAGTYDLEVKHNDQNVLSQRVYVLGGKTVKVTVKE